jgi:anaerobic selenocysteine-containing dehydrogenase
MNIEGDPAHPVSEGTLCSKGASAIQVVNNPRRLQKVLYRAPGGTAWEEKSWDWAFERIAAKVKATRDRSFKTTVNGRTVNRTESHRLSRRLGAGQRGGLSPREADAGRSVSATSSTRPDSDTAPRSPVWRPRSAEGR